MCAYDQIRCNLSEMQRKAAAHSSVLLASRILAVRIYSIGPRNELETIEGNPRGFIGYREPPPKRKTVNGKCRTNNDTRENMERPVP